MARKLKLGWHVLFNWHVAFGLAVGYLAYATWHYVVNDNAWNAALCGAMAGLNLGLWIAEILLGKYRSVIDHYRETCTQYSELVNRVYKQVLGK